MKILPTEFEGKAIRRTYDEATETWWFSVVDVVQVLTQQGDIQAARKYWNQLKQRLEKEGSESVTNCRRLKLPAADGKSYRTDVATAQTLLRQVQSIPSPKAEPIKLWLAKVGYERMTGQETRNKLTDYWRGHDIKAGEEFTFLTNIIHQEWSGVSVEDHMTEAELIFTALAELSTRQIAEHSDATGLPANKTAAQAGGGIAKRARLQLESQTGRGVVSGDNYVAPPVKKAVKPL